MRWWPRRARRPVGHPDAPAGLECGYADVYGVRWYHRPGGGWERVAVVLEVARVPLWRREVARWWRRR